MFFRIMRKILDYIDELRRKPEPARHRILLLASGGITLIIFLFWLVNFKFIGLDLGQITRRVEAVKEPTTATDLGAGFGRLKNGWQVLIERFKN